MSPYMTTEHRCVGQLFEVFKRHAVHDQFEVLDSNARMMVEEGSHRRNGGVPGPIAAEQAADASTAGERLGQRGRAGDTAAPHLDAKGQLASEFAPRPMAADHVAHVVGRRHDLHVFAARSRKQTDRMEKHRLAADLEEVLVGRLPERIHASPRAADENDDLHHPPRGLP
jgi:hypothetical protein